MPKQLIKRLMPKHEALCSHPLLRCFGTLLHDPNLWHFNRRSAAGAFAVGLFMAWVPIPFQMVLAAAAAVILRVNLPIAVALVWITNPVTIPPLFYFAYLVGSWLLGLPPQPAAADLSLQWLLDEVAAGWLPLLVGCFTLALGSAIAGFLLIRLLWRLQIIHQWQRRRAHRAARLKAAPIRSQPTSAAD